MLSGVISGDLNKVGPNTIPRFSAVICVMSELPATLRRIVVSPGLVADMELADIVSILYFIVILVVACRIPRCK